VLLSHLHPLSKPFSLRRFTVFFSLHFLELFFINPFLTRANKLLTRINKFSLSPKRPPFFAFFIPLPPRLDVFLSDDYILGVGLFFFVVGWLFGGGTTSQYPSLQLGPFVLRFNLKKTPSFEVFDQQTAFPFTLLALFIFPSYLSIGYRVYLFFPGFLTSLSSLVSTFLPLKLETG